MDDGKILQEADGLNPREPEADIQEDNEDTLEPKDPPCEENAGEPVKKERSAFVKGLISWGQVVLTALVLAILARTFLVVNATIESGSMENTIMTGDRIMCNRLAYLFREPERFEIVAFDFMDGNKKELLVKRIIGLPGETVVIEDGKVYIDGAEEPLRDDFIADPPEGDAGPFEVPEGHYFMLGDNRIHSYDSSRWPDPYVDGDDLRGAVSLRYFPNFTWFGGGQPE
jgi:signal peptidase I